MGYFRGYFTSCACSIIFFLVLKWIY
jgi:hypothetical protein